MIREKTIEIIADVCNNTTPYNWVNENYVTWDSSGKVKVMTTNELQNIVNNLQLEKCCYDNPLEELLNEIYIDESRASYVSGCGLFWTCYYNLIEEKFEEWLYDKYDVWDEDGEYLEGMEDFEFECKDIFRNVIETSSIDIYVQMIKKNINDKNT